MGNACPVPAITEAGAIILAESIAVEFIAAEFIAVGSIAAGPIVAGPIVAARFIAAAACSWRRISWLSGGARGFHGGGRGGFHGGGRGGGRRSDFRLKHDITLLGYIPNGVGFYRFVYNGASKAYVGVIAQEVKGVMPEAVFRGRDGYLRVDYDKIGVKFQTYDQWSTSGARIPTLWAPSMQ